MSVEALSVTLNMTVGDSTRKLVLVGLANHARKDGTAAWPGVKTLAEYADCSTRTVQRHLGALLESGYIREGDQRLVAHLDSRHRPIVFDVAMDMATVAEWGVERSAGTTGRRDAARAAGSMRGTSQVSRGDNVSPLRGSTPEATVNPSESRGDNLSPLDQGSGVTPVTLRGDTGDTSRGDTHVTQTVPSNHPLNQNLSVEPDGPTTEGAALIDIKAVTQPETDETGTPLREDVERVCEHLADRIEGNGSKRPTVTTKWRDAARRLMDLDGRSEAQVHNMIEWCQGDEFWKANILSMPKLREKYDSMRLRAMQSATSFGNGRKPYINSEVHGTEGERATELERVNAMTDDERAAEVRRMFGQS